jgi:hypothetical protein
MSHERNKPLDPARETQTEKMALHGITCVAVDNFFYREFHYTNLNDAIAQALRDKIRLGLIPAA